MAIRIPGIAAAALSRDAEVTVLFGVSVAGAVDTGTLPAVARSAGRAPALVMTYRQFATAPEFPAGFAATVSRHGAVPEVTWEPWDPSAGVVQPAYRLAAIIGGRHDGYLRRWAGGIRSYGGPVRLRFAHEMNGDWYPWDESVNGNRAGEYARAWRHVREVFRRRGARNATWVWSPNVIYPGSAALAGLYPGDDDVDAGGADGYNWGATRTAGRWKTFDEIFVPTLALLRTITGKPLYISEVACAEAGGDKADWITGFFAGLARHPEIRGFTWFNHDKESDWRITRSPAASRAFAAGLATLG